jgi:hypothetical protein
LAGNDRHRSSRERRSWNCFRAYILDWHDHSRDSCEAPHIDHAPKDQLDLFHPLALNEFLKKHQKVQKLEAALATVNERLKVQDAKIDRVNAKIELTAPAAQVANNSQ